MGGTSGSPALSRETPAPGLVVYQPERGFRYSMDPFLLSAWALEPGQPCTAVDIGTGSGIMALLLARQGVRMRGYDVRPEWMELARRSAQESALDVHFELVDVRTLPAADFDLALLNPPYLRQGQGRASPNPWKAAARTELNGTLSELVAAGTLLASRLCVIVRADRAEDAEEALRACGSSLSRRCDIDRSLVLLEGVRGSAELVREHVSMRHGAAWSARVRAWYARLGARLR